MEKKIFSFSTVQKNALVETIDVNVALIKNAISFQIKLQNIKEDAGSEDVVQVDENGEALKDENGKVITVNQPNYNRSYHDRELAEKMSKLCIDELLPFFNELVEGM